MIDIKSGNSIIKIQKIKYNEIEYIDIRKFYRELESGEWKPTKKGITFKPELRDEIIKALKSL